MRRWLLVLVLAPASAGAQSDRQKQYLGLAEATLRQPIAPQELRDAVLSADGVASIRATFEASIAESLVLGSEVVTPELGGEATLYEGRLILVAYPDPVHPILREMTELSDDPARLMALLESSPDGKQVLAQTGGLAALLFQITRRPPTDHERELLQKVIESAVGIHFKTWSADPEIQARMIEATDWRGRYVGFWHIHPPRFARNALGEGIEPSLQDMKNAVELGQFLTLVFQPDGFDAYDLSPLALEGAPALSLARVVRYRADDWREHFERLAHERLRH